MTVAGFATLPLLGIGALLLTYRQTSSISLVFSERHDGTAITATGDLTPDVVAAIERSLAEPREEALVGAAPIAAPAMATGAVTVARGTLPPAGGVLPPEIGPLGPFDERQVWSPSMTVRGDDVAAAVRELEVRWHVTFDTGEAVDVTSTTLVGRAPETSPGQTPVAIDDPDLSVSSRHFRLDVTDRGLTATDEGSTNGTGVVRQHRLFELSPGEPFPLEAGDVIAFGARRASVERH